MKAKEIETLENYFKTGNEHWNSYTFKILCEELKQSNFENKETPLLLLDKADSIFSKLHKTPLKAVQEFNSEIEKLKLNQSQQLFVYEWVLKYINGSDFGEIDLREIKDLLTSHTDKLKNDKLSEYKKPLTEGIRETLKDIVQKEIEHLSDTLKELDTVQRLNILCKIIPFVLPKVESVALTHGEPENEAETKLPKW